jgi:hypothetical protein
MVVLPESEDYEILAFLCNVVLDVVVVTVAVVVVVGGGYLCCCLSVFVQWLFSLHLKVAA